MRIDEWKHLGNMVKQIREALRNEMVIIRSKSTKRESRRHPTQKALNYLEKMRDNLDYAVGRQHPECSDYVLDTVFYGMSKKVENGWACCTCGNEGIGYPPPQLCSMCGKRTFVYREVIE